MGRDGAVNIPSHSNMGEEEEHSEKGGGTPYSCTVMNQAWQSIDAVLTKKSKDIVKKQKSKSSKKNTVHDSTTIR